MSYIAYFCPIHAIVQKNDIMYHKYVNVIFQSIRNGYSFHFYAWKFVREDVKHLFKNIFYKRRV